VSTLTHDQWYVIGRKILRRDRHTCRDCGEHATGITRIRGAPSTTDTADYIATCLDCGKPRQRRLAAAATP
jgi:hypothetical protein